MNGEKRRRARKQMIDGRLLLEDIKEEKLGASVAQRKRRKTKNGCERLVGSSEAMTMDGSGSSATQPASR